MLCGFSVSASRSPTRPGPERLLSTNMPTARIDRSFSIMIALFAIVQFQSWEAATLILAGVSLIQFLIGSYLEPRL